MIEATIKGQHLLLETHPDVFCPRYVDPGTFAMLSKVDFASGDRVLDLGCGYGVVGILAAKLAGPSGVYMVDNNAVAIRLSRENARRNGCLGVHIALSDGVAGLDAGGFDMILCNPPYQVDFAVPKRFIEKGFNRLKLGGVMYMVTKRKLWYRNKLIGTFGGVQVEEIDGYQVFRAERRTRQYVNGHR